jgi:hypothetical protein
VQRLPLPRLRARSSFPTPSPADVSAEYVFGRVELAALGRSIRNRLGDSGRAIGSPDEVRLAVTQVLGPWLATGEVDVQRTPGGLRTPEMWRLRLRGVRPEGRELVDSMIAEAHRVR